MNRLGPLVSEITASRTDDDGLVIVAGRGGPAGICTTRFTHGSVIVAADVAEPDHVASITITSDPFHDTSIPVLEHLLDDETIGVLAAWWNDRPGVGETTTIWAADRPSAAELDDPRFRRLTRFRIGGADEVGRLALASDEALRRPLAPLAVGLALMEVAVLGMAVEHLRPSPPPAALIEGALAQLDMLDADWFEDFGPDHAAIIEERVGLWRPGLERGGAGDPSGFLDRFDRAIELVRGRFGPPAPGRVRTPVKPWRDLSDVNARSTPALAAAPMPTALEARSDRDEGWDGADRKQRFGFLTAPSAIAVTLRADLGDDVRLIDASVEAGHLTVHLGGSEHDDVWLRAFGDGPTPTLLGLGQFGTPVRPWRSARVVLPPDLDPTRLLVDVTTHEASPWRSPEGDALDRALLLGAAAARASRSDDTEAADLWVRCADAWRSVGDDERERRATRLAEHESRHAQRAGRPAFTTGPEPTEGPLVVDLMGDLLDPADL